MKKLLSKISFNLCNSWALSSFVLHIFSLNVFFWIIQNISYCSVLKERKGQNSCDDLMNFSIKRKIDIFLKRNIWILTEINIC